MYMWNMPLNRPTGIMEGMGQGSNVVQQFQANALANQAQQIQNQYMPALDQNQVTQGQIANTYAPYQDTAAINSLNMQTMFYPELMASKMLVGAGRYGSGLSSMLSSLQHNSPYVDQNNNAIGAGPIAQNIAAIGSMNPGVFMNPGVNNQNAIGANNYTPMLPQPTSNIPTGMPSPASYSTNSLIRNPAPQIQPTIQPSVQPQVASTSPPASNISSSSQGVYTRNPLNHTIIDNQGNVMQPEGTTMMNRDQRGIAAIQKLQPLFSQLQNLGQFQTAAQEAGLEGSKLTNWLGLTKSLSPELEAQGEQAEKQIPEALIGAFNLNTTNEAMEQMQESIAPEKGETGLQYTNRLTASLLQLNDFATQSAQRIQGGYKLQASDVKNILNSNPTIYGYQLTYLENYADKNNVPLNTLLSQLSTIKEKKAAQQSGGQPQ